MRWLIQAKSRQTISQHAPDNHQAKQGTPTMGGLIILFGFMVATIAMIVAEPTLSPVLMVPLILAVGYGFIGVLDDFIVPRMKPGSRGLGWVPKLVLQIGIGAIALWVEPQFRDPIRFGIALFILLFYSNAYNFSDGLDGLSGSLGILIAIGIALASFFFSVQSVTAVCLAMIGATIIFLFYNAPPAKVFMGDAGALPIGAILGWGITKFLMQGESIIAMDQRFLAMLVLSVVMVAELVPPPLQIFSVKVFKRKLFPYTPIHHAFEKAGKPETRVMFGFVLVQLVALTFEFMILRFWEYR